MNKLFKMAGSLALAAVLTSGVVSPVYAEEQPVLTLEQAQAAEKETAETLERVEVELSNAVANLTEGQITYDLEGKKAATEAAQREYDIAAMGTDEDAMEAAATVLAEAMTAQKEAEDMLTLLENSVKRAEENVAKADAAHDAAVAALEKLTAQENPEVNPEVKPEVNPEVNPEVKVNEKTADGRKAAVSTSVK
ncbi:MAG: hypothetical protein HXL80_07245 [[Eubacterium] sulci]|jgi:family 85 glycosyl hydrolase|nr:hypothetical protein [[Eubacterium] sulci]